jgi:hypothetical protein
MRLVCGDTYADTHTYSTSIRAFAIERQDAVMQLYRVELEFVLARTRAISEHTRCRRIQRMRTRASARRRRGCPTCAASVARAAGGEVSAPGAVIYKIDILVPTLRYFSTSTAGAAYLESPLLWSAARMACDALSLAFAAAERARCRPCVRQHTSAYVSIRLHSSAYGVRRAFAGFRGGRARAVQALQHSGKIIV